MWKINLIQALNILFSLVLFASCENRANSFACDWENRLNKINSVNGETSIWHTLNKFAPDLEASSNLHDYSKDFFMQDFRQLELVSKEYEPLIIQQFEDAKSYKTISNNGFEKIYIRDKIPNPIKNLISIDSLMSMLGIAKKYDLVFRDCKGYKAKNGFYIDSKFALIVGVTNGKDEVEVLGINNFQHESSEFLIKLETLMENLNCIFVSYPEEIILNPNQIKSYGGKY